TGEGRIARLQRAWWPDGARRAHDRSRVRIAVRLAAHAGAVGDARAHTGHRRAALRQGVAPGERAATRAGVPAVARAARGARYWMEVFRLPEVTPEELDAGMAYEGFEQVGSALAAGTGAILALCHLGGWDWGGAWLATQGYPITVVVESLEPVEVFNWFVEF